MANRSTCEIKIGGTVSRQQMVTLVISHEATNQDWEQEFEGDPKTIPLEEVTQLRILKHEMAGGEDDMAEAYLKEKGIDFDRYSDGHSEYNASLHMFRARAAIDEEFTTDIDHEISITADVLMNIIAEPDLADRIRRLCGQDIPELTPLKLVDTLYECQNCGRAWLKDELNYVTDLLERVSPGEPMPAGECRICGALCHPEDDEDTD